MFANLGNFLPRTFQWQRVSDIWLESAPSLQQNAQFRLRSEMNRNSAQSEFAISFTRKL